MRGTREKIYRLSLLLEFLLCFIGIPAFFYFHANRWNIAVALWAIALYALWQSRRNHSFAWRGLWHGTGWTAEQKKNAVLRFGIAAPLLILLTCSIAPARLFFLPLQHPWFWLLVMFLYPILSVLPQEFIFRSFFFRRYEILFPDRWMMILINGLSFGFLHIIFHNFVSPILCLIGGILFAYSYSQHRSLKWSVIEHAVYGCFVFTIGIGFYFLVGGVARL